jgi:two-component system catabolic regulation response regulator CreB
MPPSHITPGKVLIVEDETAIADGLIYALQSDGFETHWTRLGQQAIERATAGDIDIILLDVGLPDINGFDVCKAIRRFSEVPILFLTARSDEIDRVVGLEIGADDYVSKPFSLRELLARIRTILKRSRAGQRQAPPQTGPWRHEVASQRLFFHDQPLELTRYEYRILLTLLDQPQRVFTRSQLMQAAWEAPDHSLERAVDTHIKTLRAKLRQIAADIEVIRTHRGSGYSLIP